LFVIVWRDSVGADKSSQNRWYNDIYCVADYCTGACAAEGIGRVPRLSAWQGQRRSSLLPIIPCTFGINWGGLQIMTTINAITLKQQLSDGKEIALLDT